MNFFRREIFADRLTVIDKSKQSFAKIGENQAIIIPKLQVY